jgi:hypothetical protein
MNNALRTVHAVRGQASLDEFKKDNPGRTIVSATWSPYGKEFPWLNLRATKAANPDWDVLAAFKKCIEGGHQNNMAAMSKKLDAMPLSCFS